MSILALSNVLVLACAAWFAWAATKARRQAELTLRAAQRLEARIEHLYPAGPPITSEADMIAEAHRQQTAEMIGASFEALADRLGRRVIPTQDWKRFDDLTPEDWVSPKAMEAHKAASEAQVVVTCPHCGTETQLTPAEHDLVQGRPLTCGDCDGTADIEDWERLAEPEDPSDRAQREAKAEARRLVTCPNCGARSRYADLTIPEMSGPGLACPALTCGYAMGPHEWMGTSS